jgi:hypothetical protein
LSNLQPTDNHSNSLVIIQSLDNNQPGSGCNVG